MNIFNLLTKKKRVAGIEISDLVIRVAYFDHKKRRLSDDNNELKVKDLNIFETPIPPNTISGGVILDKEILSKILKNIWRKERLGKRHAIVSIQEDKIYTRKSFFPKTETEDHLKQAIDLTLDFQLPIKKDNAYVGWENTKSSKHEEEVLISSIPKNITDDYIFVMDHAGISMLALETHLASISRSILTNEEVLLIQKDNQNSTTIFGLKDNSLYFSRTIPSFMFNKENTISSELLKIKNYLEFETKKKAFELKYAKAQVKNDFFMKMGLNISPGLESKWLISTGAAVRGELPDGKDDQISLLPIGTAEAYEYQKLRIFVTLMRNITIGISIFFMFAFMGTYVLSLSLAETFNNTESNLPTSLISTDMAEKENLIKEVNSLTAVTSSVLGETPNWSLLIDEINNRTTSGIVILNLRIASVKEKITVSGIAKNREILNQFKKSLQESDYLSEVELPINNLEQKGDIPFSISFMLKDPSMLFYK